MQAKQTKTHSHGIAPESRPSASDLAKKSADAIGVDEALGLFVERVRAIEYVDEVRCVQEGNSHEVWTFISAPPFEAELRFPIYDLEWEVTERISEPLLDFRVVNTMESKCNGEATIAPAGSLLLWKKADAK